MEIKTITDFRYALRSGEFAFPGGYPKYFVCGDGEPLSYDSARANRRIILEALADRQAGRPPNTQWLVVACEINWEDGALFCSNDGARIPSAYGDDA